MKWKDKKEEVYKLYKEGESIQNIEKILGISQKTISIYFKKEGQEIKIGSEYLRKYTCNSSYFDTIDSSDKAYFLGLMYADGNVHSSRKAIQITLQNSDKEILYKFKEYLEYTGKLYLDRNKYTKLIVNNKSLCLALEKLGCVPRKSLILTFPTKEQISDKFLSHFIRGFFDGDGGICKRSKSLSITSTEEFLNTLRSVLFEQGIDTLPYRKRYKDNEISAGTIYICREEEIKKFYNYIYKDANHLFIKRKYKIFNYGL